MKENTPLEGKTAVITGATAGIGLEAARTFSRVGASVIGIGRSPERCKAAEEGIRTSQPQSKVCYLVADLSVRSQVRKLTEEIKAKLAQSEHAGLDILINNAGAYSGKFSRTVDGIEYTFAINHLAPFLEGIVRR